MTGNTTKCFELLVSSERLTEAAFFGVNYGIDSAKVKLALDAWKAKLTEKEKSALAERLSDSFAGLQLNGEPELIDLEEKPVPELPQEKVVEEKEVVEEPEEELEEGEEPETEA